MSWLNKKELRYIISATIFALVMFGFVIPKLISKGIENSSPYLQFLIFNISIFVFLQIFLKATSTGTRVKIAGSIGIITLFLAIDLLTPPLLVNQQGVLLDSVQLYAGAPDYIFGYLYSSIGLEGMLVYLAVYVLTPFILLLISSRLIPNFVRRI